LDVAVLQEKQQSNSTKGIKIFKNLIFLLIAKLMKKYSNRKKISHQNVFNEDY
jgi:hypothetical protein